MTPRPCVLSVHAADAAAEDGIVADALVFDELGCRSCVAVTAVVAVRPEPPPLFEAVPAAWLEAQLRAVVDQERPDAARIGLLRNVAQIQEVARRLAGRVDRLVVSPLPRAGGIRVLDDEAVGAMRRELFPAADVVVVRAADAPLFAGIEPADLEGLRACARILREQGARAALVSGYVTAGRVIDLLDEGGSTSVFDATRLPAPRIEGIAGAHAAALTAHLARGLTLARAAQAAQRYVAQRLQRGR